MAIFYLRLNKIKKEKGASMVRLSAYGAGISLYDQHKKRTYNYSGRDDVVHQGISLPYKSKSIYKKRSYLWNAAAAKERSKKGVIGYEMIIGIPYELSVGRAGALISEYCDILSRYLACVVDYAIHVPPQQSEHHDKRNIHAHILISKRQFGLCGFKAELTRIHPHLHMIRRLWAQLANEALKEESVDERIDHRSYAERGVDQIPQIHVGKYAKYLHLIGKVPESKKKECMEQLLITRAMIKGDHAMSLTSKSSPLIKKKIRSQKARSLRP